MKSFFNVCLLLLLVNTSTYSQSYSEFLVSVNPETGTFNKIAEIPGIRWIPTGLSWKYSTYDTKNRRYIFKGLDSSMTAYLMTIDVATGNILYNPPHPNTGEDFFYMQYDTATSTLYGIYKQTGTSSPFIFASIDQVTGNVNPISVLSGITAIEGGDQFSAIDQVNGWYIFTALNNGLRLYTIDITTGSIVSNPTTQGNFREFQFDEVSNKLYGLMLSGSAPNISHTLVSINLTTGGYDNIITIPGVGGLASAGTRFSTFDSNHGRYIFRGGDSQGNWNLYSIDVNNGNVVYNPTYPLSPSAPDEENIIELQYDNLADTLYALHWGENEIAATNPFTGRFSIEIAPNPFSYEFTLTLSESINLENGNLIITNTNGTVLSEITHTIERTISVELKDISSGMYFVTLFQNGIPVLNRKIIKIE